MHPSSRLPGLRAWAWIALVLGSGCAPIAPYQIDIQPPSEALIPPSGGLVSYESTLADFWNRVSTHCSRITYGMAVEIDQRQRRQSGMSRWLLGIGSLAGLAVTVYSGIDDSPNKGVVIPLSAISGSALISAFPSFSSDARAETLRERQSTIETRRRAAVEALGAIEGELLELALLEDEGAQAEKEIEIMPYEERLRSALVAWLESCR